MSLKGNLCAFLLIGGVLLRAEEPVPLVANEPVTKNAALVGGIQTPPLSGIPAKDDDQRIFKVVPNYKTVNSHDGDLAPISAGDKFKLALHYFDPFTFGYTTLMAGIEQASNAKPGYGQGLKGYGKRYGADITDGLTNEMFVVGVFPSLLHQDPRYIRKGEGGGLARTEYALSRILIARTDSGGKNFNYPEVLGNMASGAISMAYYPSEDRNVGGIFTRMSFQIGYDALFNVLKEFYPDIHNKLFKHSK